MSKKHITTKAKRFNKRRVKRNKVSKVFRQESRFRQIFNQIPWGTLIWKVITFIVRTIYDYHHIVWRFLTVSGIVLWNIVQTIWKSYSQ